MTDIQPEMAASTVTPRRPYTSSNKAKTDPADFGIDRVCYSFTHAREVFGFSRTYLYKLIHDGELRAFKSGKTTRLLGVDLADFIARRLTSHGRELK
jgi:excisionase family DNA binding protein